MTPSRRPLATYSIVAHDEETGQVGVAVQSHWFAVGRLVAWAEAGVGAVATQSFADAHYGPLGLELMKMGRSAQEALQALAGTDHHAELRQVGMVDARGRAAAHTGSRCVPAAGHEVGRGFSVQANFMEKDTVWGAMATAYRESDGDLAERLLCALEAAEAEGGDLRGRQASALFVARSERTDRPWADLLFDLRVDDHPRPLRELRRLVHLQRAYTWMDQADDHATEGRMEEALAAYQRADGIADDEDTHGETAFWVGVTLADLGRVEEAVQWLARARAQRPQWSELLRRLPEAGLLPDDEDLLRRLRQGMG